MDLPIKEIYEKFRKNPKINPETGKKLTKNKTPYLRYSKLCDEYEQVMNSLTNDVNSLTIVETIDPILNNEVLFCSFILAVDFYDLVNLYFVCKKIYNAFKTKIILEKLTEKFKTEDSFTKYFFATGNILYTYSFWSYLSFKLHVLSYDTFEDELVCSARYIVDSWYSNSNNLLQCRFGNYKRDELLLQCKQFLYDNGFKNLISIINIKFNKTPYNNGKFSPEDKQFYEDWLNELLYKVVMHVISYRGFFHPK